MPVFAGMTCYCRETIPMDQYGVIGNPIAHSLSPQIHQLFAEQTKQALIYRSHLVALDQLQQAIADFQAQGGKGLNITAPFKQQAFTLVDACSESARFAQAINTIKFNADGTRFGDNTDGIGFIQDVIFNQRIPIRQQRILILGAGGAVRGILMSILNESPAALVIANRTASKAIALAKEFSHYGVIHAASLADLTNERFDFIINGTSAGWLELPNNILRAPAYYYDMSYGKKAEPLLQWAREQGAHVSDGLSMLIEQAAAAFYLWRGVKPETRNIQNLIK